MPFAAFRAKASISFLSIFPISLLWG